MIIPDNLTLEELIGAMKVLQDDVLRKDPKDYTQVFQVGAMINLAEVVLRELKKKQDA